MKEGWEIKTLQEVCYKITDGTHQTPKYFDKGVIFLSSRNVKTGKIDWDNIKYVDEKQHREFQKRVSPKPKDILLAKNGTTGVAAMVDRDVDFDIYVSLAHIRVKDGILPEFMLNFINSPIAKEQFNKRIKGVGVPNLHLREIREVKIPYPKSLTEQKQIVTLLDSAFAKIDQAKANIEKNIANAKELFQSKLNAIFSQKGDGWEEKTLGDDCVVLMGQSPKGTSYNSDGIGTPLINGPVEFGPEPFSKTVNSKWTTEPTKLCEEGDLILCVRGSTTGRINIAGFEACIGRGVAAIRYSKNQEWINFFIRCKQKEIYNLGTGSTFPNVSGKILTALKFSEPTSIEEQNELIDTMKRLESHVYSMLVKYEKKYNFLEELKKSLLQKAFAGELTSTGSVNTQAAVSS